MESGSSMDVISIVALALEGVLYGLSLLMFLATVYVLIKRRCRDVESRGINAKMMVTACAFCALSTAHMIIDVHHVLSGFVYKDDLFEGGPAAYFSDVSEAGFLLKISIYSVQTALADAIVIYRCYIVWGSLWAILVPSIGWSSFVACAVGTVYNCSLSHQQGVFGHEIEHWMQVFFVSTLATNIAATGLLGYRIWSIDRHIVSQRHGRGILMPSLLIIIDAGILYSASLIAAIGCYAAETNGLFIVLDLISPIISVAFYMIIIRIGMAAAGQVSANKVTRRSTGVQRSPSPWRKDDIAMKPLQVRITQFHESHIDNGEGDVKDLETEYPYSESDWTTIPV
ncbi:uncharacterized protein EV420DRAFT_208694 [Desarmillaria tabescens]|uniref:Uncharacterized protein n=1 Tax=Armillaria tabescens TaxID=1929756 RepID=A0AA39KJ56_ARMTA|nr:uncharacterized protein EV420DRAFT_208694 [Desarmillaria tabescens]KAK0460393.1 hypothetical protein EV420DRAFT_208694 [Desarmillaria tabescens]